VEKRRVCTVQQEIGRGKGDILPEGGVARSLCPKLLAECLRLLEFWGRLQKRVHEFHSRLLVSCSSIQGFGLETWRFDSADQESGL
jgi:hypothetical protein